MAELKKKYHPFYYETDGSALRAVSPAEQDPDILITAPRKVSRKVSRNRERTKSISLISVVMLGLATVLIVCVCVSYLKVMAEINRNTKRIAALEAELSELKLDNKVAEDRIEAQIDLEEVYEIATERLGMVYPEENERVSYAAHEREYVRQYEDIPNG